MDSLFKDVSASRTYLSLKLLFLKYSNADSQWFFYKTRDYSCANNIKRINYEIVYGDKESNSLCVFVKKDKILYFDVPNQWMNIGHKEDRWRLQLKYIDSITAQKILASHNTKYSSNLTLIDMFERDRLMHFGYRAPAMDLSADAMSYELKCVFDTIISRDSMQATLDYLLRLYEIYVKAKGL
jgi:hypothetical protein